MKAMFPWYDGKAVDLATLRKAAQNPGGADYQRVVGRIAESLMKEKPPTREPGED